MNLRGLCFSRDRRPRRTGVDDRGRRAGDERRVRSDRQALRRPARRRGQRLSCPAARHGRRDRRNPADRGRTAQTDGHVGRGDHLSRREDDRVRSLAAASPIRPTAARSSCASPITEWTSPEAFSLRWPNRPASPSRGCPTPTCAPRTAPSRRSSTPCTRSASNSNLLPVECRLLEVESVQHRAQRLVVDAPGISLLDERLAFGRKHFQP